MSSNNCDNDNDDVSVAMTEVSALTMGTSIVRQPMTASEKLQQQLTSNHVYVKHKEFAWVPARLLETNFDTMTATVTIPIYKTEQHIQSDGGRLAKSSKRQTIHLIDYPSHALLLQNVDEQGNLKEVQDMVDLPFLHEAAILYNLKARHAKAKPYTRTGDIVIACNPYRWYADLYTEQKRKQYAQALVFGGGSGNAISTDDCSVDPRSTLDPHVYESSSLAYRGLALEGEDQSILVSGESGAGKTETVKILLSDLASVQTHQKSPSSTTTITTTTKTKTASSSPSTKDTESSSSVSPIVQRVLDSNPLLEAFGNAKTVRNDNSSRFGKFIQLQFDTPSEHERSNYQSTNRIPHCILAGSKCEVYLLEKSRVVSHTEEERTYHIFYQLLSADEELKTHFWEGLEDTDHESFTYVGWTDTLMIENQSDADRFQHTLDSLKLVGITDETLVALMRAICIVLQLGNLLFASDETDESKSVVESVEELNDLAELMGLTSESAAAAAADTTTGAQLLQEALTIRTVTARNEVFKVPLNAQAAKDSCDAFAKEIYAKTFLWLVRAINDATCAENNYTAGIELQQQQQRYGAIPSPKKFGLIGMLDIFGFESFETNRFEQLCINYANEKLQQKFTQDIFRSVQAEYEFEGIELEEIQYDDNTDVLDLVEGRMGLLAFLNEECLRPGGSDKGFVLKAKTMNRDNACFFTDNHFTDVQFGVNHYAGPVIYDATLFVNKNTDTLASDLLECAKKSSNSILAQELANEAMMNETAPVSAAAAGAADDSAAANAAAGAAAGGKPKKKPPKKVPPKARKEAAAKSSASSSKTMTKSEMTAATKKKGSNIVGVTVWTKFRGQLSDLMTTLQKTRTRYIRCIKPNTLKQPLIMQHATTIEQLRCAGVVAAVTISRSAFPNRVEHDIILERFKSLWQRGQFMALLEELEESMTLAEAICDDVLAKSGIMVDRLLQPSLEPIQMERNNGTILKAYVIGKTRTYFRAGALEYLEALRVRSLGVWTVFIQKIVRKFVMRSKFVKLKHGTVLLQSLQRKSMAQQKYLKLRDATIVLQCWYRCIQAKRTLISLRRNYRATMIQTHWRMALAVTYLKINRKASIAVQTMVRGALQRPKFRIALHVRREEAKLENQVLALQRKLEEAESRRAEAEKKAEERARATEERIRREAAEKATREAEERFAAVQQQQQQQQHEQQQQQQQKQQQQQQQQQEEKKAESQSVSGSNRSVGGIPRSVIAKAHSRDETEPGSPSQSVRDSALSLQQQALMDESGKMLEYLRKEVFRLRNHNSKLQNDFDLLKDNNQRLMDANASAGVSFAALNQHAKQLAKGREKLAQEVLHLKHQIQKHNVSQVEVKEELKMKQAAYAAEVQSRLQYQKALTAIVDIVQERCRDTRLVEDILGIADACEGEDGGGTSSGGGGGTPASSPSRQSHMNHHYYGHQQQQHNGLHSSSSNNNNNSHYYQQGQGQEQDNHSNKSGLIGSLRSLWS